MISIITPILNESENIKPFLNHLNTLEGDFELILVDGGSTDNTISVVNKNKNIFKRKLKLVKTQQGRGKQMNAGAKIAEGNILLFLHVDCTLEKDVINLIENEIKSKKIIGGGMVQAFSNPDFFLRFISSYGNFRVKINKIFFGDYGIFIKKDVFEKSGGYDDIVFLEDVEFSKKIKKYGELIQINRKITTSSRRFESIGKFKVTLMFVTALIINISGVRPKFLIKYIVNK
jgi:rSAM/selenodomain-associated transferase 2